MNEENEKYIFPNDPRQYRPLKHGRQKYPGVYRWVIIQNSTKEETRKVLIGQSENLRRRLFEYKNPGTLRDKVWNLYFKESAKRGARIECEYLTFRPFTINGAPVSQDALGSPFVRCLIENLVLMLTQEENAVVLNRAKEDTWTLRERQP